MLKPSQRIFFFLKDFQNFLFLRMSGKDFLTGRILSGVEIKVCNKR